MFGKEALKYIEYVECYPEGYRRGVKLAAACSAANVQGFPTWVINGQVCHTPSSPHTAALSYLYCINSYFIFWLESTELVAISVAHFARYVLCDHLMTSVF